MATKNEAELLSSLTTYSPSLSIQEQLNIYLGNNVTKYSFQEALNIINGNAATEKPTQRILWENLKDYLGLTGGYTDFSVQELLQKAVDAGYSVAKIIYSPPQYLKDMYFYVKSGSDSYADNDPVSLWTSQIESACANDTLSSEV